MRSKKTEAVVAGFDCKVLNDPTFNKRYRPIEFVDRGRDGDLFVVFQDDSAVSAYLADLFPFCRRFTIRDALFKYLENRFTLSYPRKKRDDVNDKKG